MRPRNWWIISAAALAAERLVDATKEAEETATAAATAATGKAHRTQVRESFDKTTRPLAGVSTEV